MKYKYIAIEREYGSGGTEIARKLSEECNVPCYGSEILEAVAKEKNVTVESIQKYEESVSNSWLYTVYAMGQMQSGNANILPADAQLFVAEHEFIRKSALNGRGIYLGHCAGEALKDFDVLNVFIRCSDKSIKANRIKEQYGIQDKYIDSTQKKFDNKRSKYYFANTARKWNDFTNYDMVLDSAILGIDGCVAALKALVK